MTELNRQEGSEMRSASLRGKQVKYYIRALQSVDPESFESVLDF